MVVLVPGSDKEDVVIPLETVHGHLSVTGFWRRDSAETETELIKEENSLKRLKRNMHTF